MYVLQTTIQVKHKIFKMFFCGFSKMKGTAPDIRFFAVIRLKCLFLLRLKPQLTQVV